MAMKAIKPLKLKSDSQAPKVNVPADAERNLSYSSLSLVALGQRLFQGAGAFLAITLFTLAPFPNLALALFVAATMMLFIGVMCVSAGLEEPPYLKVIRILWFLVPGLNLVLILSMDSWATLMLRKHGISVGFLGKRHETRV